MSLLRAELYGRRQLDFSVESPLDFSIQYLIPPVLHESVGTELIYVTT